MKVPAEPGWSGAVGFYGWPTRTGKDGRSPVSDARTGRVRVPVLALYGEADDKIPAKDRTAYDHALADAGVRHDSVTYPGAAHSFFDRHMTEQQAACTDSWRRLLAFVR